MNRRDPGRMRAQRVADVLLVTIDRVSKANAYTTRMMTDLNTVVDCAARDRRLRGAVLTGAGAWFCAGADLDEVGSRTDEDALDLLSREVIDRWARLPCPTIAAVNGAAMGGGFELALACDICICAPAARFQFPEVSRGLLPAAGGIRRMLARTGVSRANEMILFGRALDAPTAASWGLVAEIADAPVTRALTWLRDTAGVDPLTSRVAKLAVEGTERLVVGRGFEAVAQALCYRRRQSSDRP